MESSPALPEPFEAPVERDKKDKKERKKSSSFTLRVPLPADALHGADTKKSEPKVTSERGIEGPAGILPIFPKRERKPVSEIEQPAPAEIEQPIQPVAEATADTEPAAESTTEVDEPRAHPDLKSLSHDLWQDFDAAPRVPFDTVGDWHAVAEKTREPAAHKVHEEAAETAEMPAPDLWHESRTLHLNEAPVEESPRESDVILPSSAALSAEVAATEPDEQSIANLERAYAAPAAELPVSHPEAQAKPLPPLTEQQRFQDIMTRTEFSDDFVRQTSTPVQPIRNTGNAYYAPTVEVVQTEPIQPAESVPFTDTRQWYPPQYYQPNRPVAAAMEGAVAGAIVGGAGTTAAERPRPATPITPAEQSMPQAHIPQEHVAANYAPTPSVEQAPQQQVAPVVAERPAPIARPQEAVPQTETITAAPAAAIVAEAAPQQLEEHKTHTVESAWHHVQVENGTNRIVEGQPEGRALMEEKRVERTPVAATDDLATEDNQRQDQSIINASMYQQPLPGAINPMIASGQIDYSHELASGRVDDQHRLGTPRNPVATALTSPLLWVGVVVLLLAFFAAAFL
jgi:hypothetical protein